MLASLISLTLDTDGNESTNFSLSGESISKKLKLNLLIVKFLPMSIGIEAQLLSDADIQRGVNVTFPMKDSNISVKSVVPTATLSKQTF